MHCFPTQIQEWRQERGHLNGTNWCHFQPAIAPVRPGPAPVKSSAPAPKPVRENTPPQSIEERIEMPKAQTTCQETQSQNSKVPTAFEHLQKQVEKIKTALKDVLIDLNDAMKLVAQAAKEKNATDKEIESLRESLQQIQRMKI